MAEGKTQHVPWAPSKTERVQVEDGPFTVDGVPESIRLWRKNWPYGGYEAFGQCDACKEHVKAGGGAGEAAVGRWAVAHQCNILKYIEGEEDKNLFRD